MNTFLFAKLGLSIVIALRINLILKEYKFLARGFQAGVEMRCSAIFVILFFSKGSQPNIIFSRDHRFACCVKQKNHQVTSILDSFFTMQVNSQV